MSERNKEALIEGLNRDLAEELGTIVRYIQQAARARGALGHELRELLLKEVADEVRHAQYLADKIAILGGVPTVETAPFKETADAARMIEIDLVKEREAVVAYTERCRQAEAVGEIGLKVDLEGFIADETRHAEELERLRGH
ncbi:MAG: ferritin-like domain-containing protein [Nitrospinota bacterium]